MLKLKKFIIIQSNVIAGRWVNPRYKHYTKMPLNAISNKSFHCRNYISQYSKLEKRTTKNMHSILFINVVLLISIQLSDYEKRSHIILKPIKNERKTLFV